MMPQQPGETSLTTLFVDVHYYFSHPKAKPLHHRFDKSSYVYLFQNVLQRRGRIEVANNAGTADQDAFTGYLDLVHIEYSYKHPTFFTITVGDSPSSPIIPSPVAGQDTSKWHLPAPDPQNQGKYMFKIHTMDLYFWTKADAETFLEALGKVVPEHQMKILDAPVIHSEHRDSMSPVVQKLEKAAISSPLPSQGRSNSNASSAAYSNSHAATTATPLSSISSVPVPPESPSNFAPIPYNPAAPAKPEPIAHREKTPPPPDGAAGTGLQAAATHDYPGPPQFQQQQHPAYAHHLQHQQQYSPAPSSTPSFQSFPGPPQQQAVSSHPPPHLQRASTVGHFPPPPPSAPPNQQYGYSPAPQASPSYPYGQQHSYSPQQATAGSPYGGYAAPPPQHPAHQQQQYPYGAPSPHTPVHSQSYHGAPSPAHPPGGYSQYSYSQQQQAPQGQDVYGVHQQVYRPTEGEAHSHTKPSQGGQAQATGKLEQRMDRVEKGVGKFLKKLDKKF